MKPFELDLESAHFAHLKIEYRPPERVHVRARDREEAISLLARLPQDGLAIVGTRLPQARGLQFTRDVVQALSGTRLIILSGLALGIDAQAHWSALQAGLPTIAVMGGGLDEIYPSRHRELAQKILHAGGLLVSEFDPDFKPRPWSFILRNRLIAGWSRATWVVQSAQRSGALNTATWARDFHRDTYSTPSFPGDPAFAGNQTMIDRDHAYPLWAAHSFGHTWSDLRNSASNEVTQCIFSLEAADGSGPPLDPTERALLEDLKTALMAHGSLPFEQVFEKALLANRSGNEGQEALFRLMTRGIVKEAGGTLVII